MANTITVGINKMDPLYPEPGQLHLAPSVGVCDPHMNGLSLQEMIDTDIKAEFDDVMQGNPEGFQNMDSFELLDSDFKLDDGMAGVISSCLNGGGWGTNQIGNGVNYNGVQAHNNVTFNSALTSAGTGNWHNDELPNNSVMVNPNNVMPINIVGQHMTQPAHVSQQITTNAVSGNLSINTQYSNVQNGHVTMADLSPALSLSPGYPQQHQQQQLSQVSPMYNHQQQNYIQQQQHLQIQQQQRQQQQLLHAQQQQQQQQLNMRPNTMTKTVKVLPPASSPMQQVPSNPTSIQTQFHNTGTTTTSTSATGAQQQVVVNQLINQTSVVNTANNSNRKKNQNSGGSQGGNVNKENSGLPKPGYSYSCLIALSLKNSHTGHLSVSEIYKFMCEHFPYFKTAPTGWKNSVRHNLSLNKCFEKIEKPSANGTNQRKGCLWAMNPAKIQKMDEEVAKWSRKDPMAIKKGMTHPHHLEQLERGEMIKDYNANTTGGAESEDEEDPRTPTSVSSQGSQGYDSAGSDFVDIEGFTAIPDSSLPELQLQATGGIFEDFGNDRLQFPSVNHQGNNLNQNTNYNNQHLPVATATIVSSTNPQHHQQNLQQTKLVHTMSNHQGGGGGYYPTAIHANYAIAPAPTNGQSNVVGGVMKGRPQTLVVQRHAGQQKLFSVGGPSN